MRGLVASAAFVLGAFASAALAAPPATAENADAVTQGLHFEPGITVVFGSETPTCGL